MSDTVYVHVGIEKTGSTYLQGLLETNRSLITKLGYRLSDAGKESAHNYWLAKALGFKYQEHRLNVDLEDRAIVAAIEEDRIFKNNDLILTSEHFDFNLNSENTFRLRDIFSSRRFVVVLFLRNQVDYAQSLYLEHLKWAGVKDFASFLRMTARQQRYDFIRRLDLWESVADKVEVVDYDCSLNSLKTVFVESIGLGDHVDAFCEPEGDPNVTPSIDMMEFVRVLNSKIPREERRGNYERISAWISKNLPHLLKRRPFPIPEDCVQIFLAAEKSNCRLAERLGVDRNLFLGGPVDERLKILAGSEAPSLTPVLNGLFG